jgi:hypothetical protein
MKKKLGELLIEAGATTAADLNAALAAQRAGGAGRRVGALLLGAKKISASALARALAVQFELPFTQIPAVTSDVARLVPADYQIQNRLVAFKVDTDGKSQRVHLAVDDPTNLAVIDELRFQMRQVMVVYVAAQDDVDNALEALKGDGLEEIQPEPADDDLGDPFVIDAPPVPAAAPPGDLPDEWAAPAPVEDLFAGLMPSSAPAAPEPPKVSIIHFGGAAAKSGVFPPVAVVAAPVPIELVITPTVPVPAVRFSPPAPAPAAPAPLPSPDPSQAMVWPIDLEQTPALEAEPSADVDLTEDEPDDGGQDVDVSLDDAESAPEPAATSKDILAAADALEARLLTPRPSTLSVTAVTAPRPLPLAVTVTTPPPNHTVETVARAVRPLAPVSLVTPVPGRASLEFSEEDLKVLDSLEKIAAGAEPDEASEKVKPARMVASLIRLLIKKNVIHELEFLDELTRK